MQCLAAYTRKGGAYLAKGVAYAFIIALGMSSTRVRRYRPRAGLLRISIALHKQACDSVYTRDVQAGCVL